MAKNCHYEKTDYGLYIRFVGRVCKYDIQEWFEELKPVLSTLKRHFNLIVDFRDIKPLCADTARILGYTRSFLHGRGLRRTAIISSTSATIMELMDVFSELGPDHLEKHISSAIVPNWKEVAEAWVRDGIEP